MEFNIENAMPSLVVKNEEYWMYFVLRDVLEVFGKAVILDTGSTDKTKEIIKWFRDVKGYRIHLIEVYHKNNANLIGNSWNVLRKTISEYWMFVVSGDEIWTLPQLDILMEEKISMSVDVGLVGGHNVEDVHGELLLRHDLANYDRIFSPNVVWTRTDHPYESYYIEKMSKDKIHYFNSNVCFYWHVRHTRRSSADSQTFFRNKKYDFFPYNGEYVDLPENWLGRTNNMIWENPYV